MTLDEVIVYAKEVAKRNRREATYNFSSLDGYYNQCKKYAEEHEQLVEWLEDYKRVKKWKDDVIDEICKYDANSIEELVYNVRRKAINDFTERLKDSLMSNYKHLLSIDSDGFAWITTDAVETHIDNVVDQLKAGITDD